MMFVMGLRWLVDPSGAAAGIGMPVLDGLARSSQIGDLGAFFHRQRRVRAARGD